MADDFTVLAACHCRTVRFEVRLEDGVNSAQRCNCSFCRMRGAIAISVALEGIHFVAGSSVLQEYRFNTRTAKHYFCNVCGIYTHHQRRSDPHRFCVNAACIEGVSPFDFAKVPVNDGAHHPSDIGPGATPRVVGVLRFERSDLFG